MGFARGELPQTHWPSSRGTFQVEGALFANDVELLCDAAVAGLGIALLPWRLAEPHLASGALVPVLPDAIRAEAQLSVVYKEREFMSPQLRAFIDALVAWVSIAFVPQAGAPRPKRAAKKRRAKGV